MTVRGPQEERIRVAPPEPLTKSEREIALAVATREGGETRKWLNLVLEAYDGQTRRLADAETALEACREYERVAAATEARRIADYLAAYEARRDG